ncbi:hypothetical protein [Palleronia sp.]|uniref:hypothetical protein n=1 Tax=Palleronia sp. TaxID=1940284 RepID=UPI0035C7BB33
MSHYPAIVLSALLATATFGTTGAMAQDAARVIQESEVEGDPTGNGPDWPAGLEDWDSSPRDVEGDPDEAEERGLLSPDVTEHSAEGPTEQGTRTTETLEEEDDESLYFLLSRVRTNPPGLDGTPIPRPNPLASEPAKEMVPAQPEDVSLFRDDYIE